MNIFLESFWNPRVWLPPPLVWKDMVPDETNHLPSFNHLYYYPVPFAVGFIVVRYFLERHCYAPFGRYLGVRNKKQRKLPENPIIESFYKSKKSWSLKHVCQVGDKIDWSGRDVHRWLRIRRQLDKPGILDKFCETTYRFHYYTFSFIFGLWVLTRRNWFWDIKECWTGFPQQPMANDIWWYYMFNLGFYWSLAISQFTDIKRKDFWQMFIHHIATIALLSFSWTINAHRIGSLVIIVHDFADVFLEAVKMAKYANYNKLCDTLFMIFTLSWIVTRTGVFPLWIIKSLLEHSIPPGMDIYPAYFIFSGLLSSLLFLHIFWTYLILKMLCRALTAGQVEGDIRSSSENEFEEEVETRRESAMLINGKNGTTQNGNHHVNGTSLKSNGKKYE